MAHRHRRHLSVGPAPGQEPDAEGKFRYYQTACGEQAYRGITPFTEAEEHVTCPECLKVITKRLLAERDAAGLPKLELRKFEHGRYRYTYEAWLGGEHVGYIGMEGAYGKTAWVICRISAKQDNRDAIELGYELDDGHERYTHALKWASKEKALLAIPELLEAGKLRSAAAAVAEAKEWDRRMAAGAIRRAKEEAEAKQARAELLEGLDSIRTRAEAGEIGLTNFEIAGLTAAIKKLTPKPDPADEPPED